MELFLPDGQQLPMWRGQCWVRVGRLEVILSGQFGHTPCLLVSCPITFLEVNHGTFSARLRREKLREKWQSSRERDSRTQLTCLGARG